MKKYLILMLAALLLAAGCSQQQTTTGPSPFVGGTKGLIAEFQPIGGIQEAGVYTTFEGETFPIQVTLKNQGEYDVAPGEAKVSIYGILLSEYSGISSGMLPNTKKIEKISDLNDEQGGEEIINFGQNVKYNPAITTTFYDANVFASYTYKYKTYATVPNVCFKENLRDERVCTVEESKTLYCSGAPIQVKSVSEKPAGAGIVSLDFEIENVGGGKSTISGQEFSAQYNQFSYAIEPSAEAGKWTCTAAGRENEARLIDSKATIKCRLINPLNKDDLYTKQIALTLSYDYRDIIQQTVRIKKTI